MKRYVIAKYIRLSLEDTKYDSLSIENQRLVIDTHIAGMPESDCAETHQEDVRKAGQAASTTGTIPTGTTATSASTSENTTRMTSTRSKASER